MRIFTTRWLIAGAAAASLLVGWILQARQQPTPPPFTPETSPAAAQTLGAFKPIQGLTMELVASEPVIRQPIDLHFDDRGRLWVVQYLQYPFPAGLNITSYDQYLRARYSGVPAAPPNHVRGADKITVLEDTDGDGIFDAHKDVITGLNITTSVLTGRGGVWVAITAPS